MMAKIKRICEQCGKNFFGYAKRFCSRDCYEEWRQTKKTKRFCELCGSEIKTRGAKRFCSPKCFFAWRQGENHPNWKSIKRTCKQCGKIFFVKPSELKRGKERGTLCSRDCLKTWQRENKEWQEHMKRMRKKRVSKPTKPERIFQEICRRNNLDFHYVGDGQLWIGKKGKKQLNPDFIEANGKKICVEIMGNYWHSPLLNNDLREDALQPFREKHYKRYKWQSIFIWETDLLRKDAEQFVLNTLLEVV